MPAASRNETHNAPLASAASEGNKAESEEFRTSGEPRCNHVDPFQQETAIRFRIYSCDPSCHATQGALLRIAIEGYPDQRRFDVFTPPPVDGPLSCAQPVPVQ